MAKWQKLKNNLELQEDPFLKFDMIDQRIIYVFFFLRHFTEEILLFYLTLSTII